MLIDILEEKNGYILYINNKKNSVHETLDSMKLEIWNKLEEKYGEPRESDGLIRAVEQRDGA